MSVLAAQPLTAELERAAVAFLSQRPIENVYLTWLIERDVPGKRTIHLAMGKAGTVSGVGCFGRQVVLAAQGDAAIAALAHAAPLRQIERMIVAPRETAAAYWRIVAERHAPARIVRGCQPVFAVTSETLRKTSVSGVSVRRATAHETDLVAENSGQMILHELEYDPRPSPEFRINIAAMIDRGLWWVGEYEGRVCFFCNTGAESAYTRQLQGIWTPPALRGRGLALSALTQICEIQLREVPSVSLYVNDFNARAIALYERAGFAKQAEFSTLLF